MLVWKKLKIYLLLKYKRHKVLCGVYHFLRNNGIYENFLQQKIYTHKLEDPGYIMKILSRREETDSNILEILHDVGNTILRSEIIEDFGPENKPISDKVVDMLTSEEAKLEAGNILFDSLSQETIEKLYKNHPEMLYKKEELNGELALKAFYDSGDKSFINKYDEEIKEYLRACHNLPNLSSEQAKWTLDKYGKDMTPFSLSTCILKLEDNLEKQNYIQLHENSFIEQMNTSDHGPYGAIGDLFCFMTIKEQQNADWFLKRYSNILTPDTIRNFMYNYNCQIKKLNQIEAKSGKEQQKAAEAWNLTNWEEQLDQVSKNPNFLYHLATTYYHNRIESGNKLTSRETLEIIQYLSTQDKLNFAQENNLSKETKSGLALDIIKDKLEQSDETQELEIVKEISKYRNDLMPSDIVKMITDYTKNPKNKVMLVQTFVDELELDDVNKICFSFENNKADINTYYQLKTIQHMKLSQCETNTSTKSEELQIESDSTLHPDIDNR